jgi:hypothetical protein
MSDSAEIVLTLSVLTCQTEQFMSDSAEILIFTQSNSLQRIVQLSDTFRQVCSAEQGQIFSLGCLHIRLNRFKFVTFLSAFLQKPTCFRMHAA